MSDDSLKKLLETSNDGEISFAKSNFKSNIQSAKTEKAEIATPAPKEEAKVIDSGIKPIEEEIIPAEEPVAEVKEEAAPTTDKQLIGIPQAQVPKELAKFYVKQEDGSFKLNDAALAKSYIEAEKRMSRATQETAKTQEEAIRVQNELNKVLLKRLEKTETLAPAQNSEDEQIRAIANQLQGAVDSGKITQAEAMVRMARATTEHIQETVRQHREQERVVSERQNMENTARANFNTLATKYPDFQSNYDLFLDWEKDVHGAAYSALENTLPLDLGAFDRHYQMFKASTKNPQEHYKQGLDAGVKQAQAKRVQAPTRSTPSAKTSPIEPNKKDDVVDEMFAHSGFHARVRSLTGR